MATIKRLTGNVSVGITGKQALDFTNYGTTGGGGGPVDPPTGPGGDVIFPNVVPYRMNILEDPTGGSVVAVSGVSAGKAYVRPDGFLGLDLRDVPGLPFITGSYLRAGGTSPGAVTFQCNIVDGATGTVRLFGMPPGLYYLPEIDANDAVVVEPTENTRFCYISPSGFSVSQIATAHSISTGAVNGVFLRDTVVHPSLGGNGTAKYGETAAFALQETPGRALAITLTQNVGQADVHVLFQRGGAYTIGATLFASSRGYSKLHPAKIGAYGTGARPTFTNLYTAGSWGTNVVLQDMVGLQSGGWGQQDGSFRIIDNMRRTGPVQATVWAANGNGGVNRGCTMRRTVVTDQSKQTASNMGGLFWGTGSAEKNDSMYISASSHSLVEKLLIETTGWAWGYRVDRDGDFPQSPNNQSHGGYMQGDNSDITFRDAIISWPNFSMTQARSSGHFERLVGWGQNGPFSVGGTGQLQGTIDNGGNYAYVADLLMTEAGQKDYIRWTNRTDRDGPPFEWAPGQSITTTSTAPNSEGRRSNSDGGVLRFYVPLNTGTTGTTKPTHTSGDVSDGNIVWRYDPNYVRPGFNSLAIGFNNQNVRTFADRVIVAHTTPGPAITSQTQIFSETSFAGRATTSTSDPYKPTSKAQEAGGAGSHDYGDVKVWNWVSPTFNWNVTGLNTTDLNNTTLFRWHDAEYGTTGSTMLDVRTSLRAEEAPWQKVESILRFFMGPFGWGSAWTPRTSATTVTFLPSARRGNQRPDINNTLVDARRGGTPGFRADCRDDWTTLDLPGTVTGDNVSLGGYPVRWNITPKNPLGTFRFAGGELEMTAGILKPTAFLDGGDIRMSQGTKLYIDGHSGETINIEMSESRFLNTGSASNVSITARYRSEVVFGYDGSSFTIPSGQHVTLHGDVLAGFDGEVGGTTSLTVQSGGALNFRPGLILSMNMLKEQYEDGRTSGPQDGLKMCTPRLGTILTSSSGGSGRVVEWIGTLGTRDFNVDNARALIILDEVTGTFQNGDTITGTRSCGVINWPDGVLGTVNAIPTVTSPVIRNFATGIDGRRTHNVGSSITFNAGAIITATGFPTGTDVNLITGVPITNNATLPSGLTVVGGNTLRLVV